MCVRSGGGVGAAGVAAVSNGSCLTGPWEIELKRSIRYNVNNDPSSHCAVQDKSIKDPSRPVIAIPCQRLVERAAAHRRGRGSEEWMLKHKTIFKSAQQNSTRIVIKCPLTFSGEPFLFQFFFFFFYPSYSGMQLLVICYGRFAAQWNPSGIGVIPLPPHWSSINEAILTNTFWCLWNHFWKGVFNDTSCEKTRMRLPFKSASFENNRGVLFTGSLSFYIQGAIARKNICTSFPVALSSWGEKRCQKVVSQRFENVGLHSSARHCISPETDEQWNICLFHFSRGLFCNCTCACESAIWDDPLGPGWAAGGEDS